MLAPAILIGLLVASVLLAILNKRVLRRIEATDPNQPAPVIDLTDRARQRDASRGFPTTQTISPPPWREIAELDTRAWSLPTGPSRDHLSVLPGSTGTGSAKQADDDAEAERPPLKIVADNPHPYDELINMMDWVEARESKP